MAGRDTWSVAATAAACAGFAVGAVCAAKLLASDGSERASSGPERKSRRRRHISKIADYEYDSKPGSRLSSKQAPMPRKDTWQNWHEAGEEEEAMAAGWQGFSMAEARELADACQKRAFTKTPQEVLAELQKGNMRFWTGCATRPEKSAFERRALISKQFPSVAILGCSDSRVPIEIVFDVGLGDAFVVRVAGNCLDTTSLGSLQYAVNHLKVKVLVVLGHEGCGAIKAAGLPGEKIAQEPAALASLLRQLKGGLNENGLAQLEDSRARDREAVAANVKHQIEALTHDEGILQKINAGDLLCVGAMYELSSGIVDFFAEVAPAKLDATEGAVKEPKIENPVSPVTGTSKIFGA
eukprot:TRINITY_DN6040_c0_g1_i2.p1 TRINITY_DN6040_c0_g1~~TRINITY_DN6040_c0_g1_i2.p1  ORF type:complete len:353 (+),score=78.49 TRINITY_DN6040_c0_g1_i2:89-1147(+)